MTGSVPTVTPAAALRALHVPGDPVLLPCAWDAASARILERMGRPAVATGSAGVAEALGFEDHEAAPVDEMFAAIARVCAAVSVPVTADVEAGYGLAGDELVERLLAAGAVGCNLEDSDHARPGALVDADVHAQRLAAVRAAAGDRLVINARTDAILLGRDGAEAECVRRGRLYAAAGADCVYPIGASDPDQIGRLVEAIPAPVNVLRSRAAPPLARLRELGVARVSWGPFWMRDSYAAADRIAREQLT